MGTSDSLREGEKPFMQWCLGIDCKRITAFGLDDWIEDDDLYAQVLSGFLSSCMGYCPDHHPKGD